MLSGAEAAELAIDHDSDLGTESFSLFHRVSSQDNSRLLSLSGYVGNNCPHEPLGLRINTSAGLIQKYDGRVTNQSYSTLELALVTTGEVVGMYVFEICQVHVLDLLGD